MRIALLTYSTRPRGGVVHTLALAEALAAAGQEVDVWTLSRGGDRSFFRPVDPAVRTHVVPLDDVPDETVGERVTRSVAALGAAFSGASCPTYDVVHAQDCITANAVPDCLRTVHHLDTFTTPQLVACHETAILRPRGHVCVSAAVAAELREQYGVTATVIPNGVDSARFTAAASHEPAAVAARAAWRDRLGGYVLAVGGIEPRKGSRDLLEAMALLRAERPDLRLVVAGGETLFDYRDYRRDFDARAVELGVAPLVLGPVGHDVLPALVAAADAFAFPSTKEGFGLAALEALAAGVPVVARDLPVLREVMGDAALYAATVPDLATQLRVAAGPRDLARARAGRETAGRYTWAAAAQAHLALYGRSVGGGGGEAARIGQARAGRCR